MCKKIEELVANQFKNLTGVPAESMDQLLNMEVYPRNREPFVQLMRSVLPDLRISRSDGFIKVADFAQQIENSEAKKRKFFERGLEIVRRVTGNPDYQFEDDLYPDLRPDRQDTKKRLSQEANYFCRANRVYMALAKELNPKNPYYPELTRCEKASNLRDLIDLYYRRGKF